MNNFVDRTLFFIICTSVVFPWFVQTKRYSKEFREEVKEIFFGEFKGQLAPLLLKYPDVPRGVLYSWVQEDKRMWTQKVSDNDMFLFSSCFGNVLFSNYAVGRNLEAFCPQNTVRLSHLLLPNTLFMMRIFCRRFHSVSKRIGSVLRHTVCHARS